MNRLMIGSGIFQREGWQTLDCNPAHRADFVAQIPPFPEAAKEIQWDEIEWIHGITSLYPWDGETALREIHGILIEGGKLILEQPDFQKARERVEWVFGDGLTRQEPLLMNRWAYSPESLTDALLKAGFRLVKICRAQYHVPGRDFRVEAFA